MDRLDPMTCPPAPVVRMPLVDRLTCLRQSDKGFGQVSEARRVPGGGRARRPQGVAAEFAMVTSSQKAHDVSGASDGTFGKAGLGYDQVRQWSDSEPCGFRHQDTTFPFTIVSVGPVPVKVRAR